MSLMGAITVFHFAAMPWLTLGAARRPLEPDRAREAQARDPARRANHARHRSTDARPHGLKRSEERRRNGFRDHAGTAGAGRLGPRRARAASARPTLVRDIVENGSAPEQPWKSARELGWTSIDLPERLGGLELGFTALGLVIEQHGCFIAPGPFLATVTQFLPLVCEAGSPDQLERFAKPAGAGERTGALAIDHGCAAEHQPGDRLHARRDGDAWILDGERHVRARRRRRGRDRRGGPGRRGRRRGALRGAAGRGRVAARGRARREPPPRPPALRRRARRRRPRARPAGRERRARSDARSSARRSPPRSNAWAPARPCWR